MFDIFFGWRKASKCKKLIKRVQCRLKLLKNKRNSIVKQLREDVAQLIKLGYEEIAFNRVEQLFKDESIMAVYDMLDNFCEFVNLQLSYIRRNKDCPNDVNEAVSSLIFASARCADLPELPAIRKFFGERYGQRFATAAVELLPGNLVNPEIKEKLSIKSVSDDMKYRLIDEIARDYCLKPEILALEYFPEMPEQPVVEEISEHQELDRNDYKSEGSQMQTSNANEINGKSIQVDPLALRENLLMRQCQSYSYPNSDAICTSLGSSQHHSPHQMDSPLESTVDTPGDGERQRISWICTTSLKHKDEKIKAPSSPESLPQFSEEAVVYLDDIEELQSSKTKEGDLQEQIVFKFKSPTMPKREHASEGYEAYDESYTDHDELQDERSSSRISSKSRNSYGKRSRRKSFSRESSSMKDTDHEIYYEKPCTNSPIHEHKSHHIRKLQKKRLKQPCCNCHFNSTEVNVCSLENPCYFCTGGDDGEEKRCHCQSSRNGGSKNDVGFTKMEQINPTQNLRRRSFDINGSSTTVYKVLSLPKMQKEKSMGKVKGYSDFPGSHVSSNSSHTRKQTVSPYLRAMTMPQERPREMSHKYSILRSNSLSFQNPNHVHPKLPDYDDLAAKFMALKKEHLLYK